jgi:hypothetical protein
MPKLVLEGRNRFVILTRRNAIKIPSLRCWRDFLFGVLNNLNEAQWSREHAAYCPVRWISPLGFVLVMPRAERIAESDFRDMSVPALPGVEMKASSWGLLGGRLVALDYGWR